MAEGDPWRNYTPAKINLLDGDLSARIRSVANCDTEQQAYQCITCQPELVKKAHQEFLQAGSNFIRTFTYRATSLFINRNVQKNHTERIIRKTVSLALCAVNEFNANSCYWGPAKVVGCCGDNQYLRERISGQELWETHLHRIQTLINSGVEILSFEDVYDLEEANMLLELIRQYPNTRALIMFDSRNFGKSNRDLFRNTVHNCYFKSADKILAIGIQGGTPSNARMLLKPVNESRYGHNLIPCVACTDNMNYESAWEPVWTETVNPRPEWEMMGLQYIGGNFNVSRQNILWNRIQLN